MKLDEIRLKLIKGTIQVIAEEGLDKASTKLIGLATNTNEAYIYRCFKDKSDMFAKTFAYLDDKLVTKCMQHVAAIQIHELDYATRYRIIFTAVWRFMLGNRDECLTFIRYYYSPYFTKLSLPEHEARYAPLLEKIRPTFREEANVWMILNHVLCTMMDFAIKVFNNTVPNDEDTEEHVFRLVLFSTQQYFKTKES